MTNRKIDRGIVCCGLGFLCLLVVNANTISAQNSDSQLGDLRERVIAANYTQVKGKHDGFFREVVGAGRAAEGLRANWVKGLGVVHRVIRYTTFNT